MKFACGGGRGAGQNGEASGLAPEVLHNIPLIARNIGQTERNTDDFVSLLDLPPTFLDIADVAIPDQYDGHRLTDIGSSVWRDDIVAEFHGHKYAYEQRMLRTEHYKLVVNEADTNELYDLEEDPHELNNRIANPEYGEVATALHARLRDRVEATSDELPSHVRTKVSCVDDVWTPE